MSNYDFELDLETQNTMSVINRWIEPEHSVLEFGPANGRLTKHLAQNKNCSMTIVELDSASGAEAASYAEKSYVGEELGDIEKYHWLDTDQKYDSIIFADVLEHLRDPETVLKNCNKVLKDTGSILISVPNLSHNSIIISLVNDQFAYSETGLLDRTHVHFFTYESLLKTITDSGYYMNEIVPIYSRVGDNEISATYEQVPVSLERYLRKRRNGYVYQFVCRISKTDTGNAWQDSIKPFEQEYYRQIEAQCYYTTDQQPEFSDDMLTSAYFSAEEQIHMCVNLPARTQKIRLDPLVDTGIVQLKKAEIITKDGQHYTLEVHQSTAEYVMKNLYFFTDSDPQFVFDDIPVVEEVQFSAVYQILSFSESAEFYQTRINALKCADIVLERQLDGYESQINELKAWNAHLESDLVQISKAREEELQSYESTAANLKAWTVQLECDLAQISKVREEELQSYESTAANLKAWTVQLECDLAQISKAREEERQSYESTVANLKAWTMQLECDLARISKEREEERQSYESTVANLKAWTMQLECDLARISKEREEERQIYNERCKSLFAYLKWRAQEWVQRIKRL